MQQHRSAIPFAAGANKRIMIVDDNPDTERMYRDVLAPAGYQVWFAPLHMLTYSYDQFERPDLLLLDWIFGQEWRGIQTLQQLKLWPATAPLPMLVAAVPITTIDDLPGLLRSRQVAFVAKPFSADELLEAVAAAAGAGQ